MAKAVKGSTYKKTIHDGSVSYSVIRMAPPSGMGNHAKTNKQVLRREFCSALARRMKRDGVRNAYAQARAIVYADVYMK